VELLSAIALLALLAFTRSWITLALFAAVPFSVYLTTTGVNDYTPALLLALSLLVAERHRIGGAVLLAATAAVKPYAAAWFVPLIGFAGWGAALGLAVVSLVAWAPLMGWGLQTYLASIQLQAAAHPIPENTINIPVLRWAAVPLAVAGLLVRRWETMVLVGSAAFIVFLFFAPWASLGYWVVVGPVSGIALERLSFGRSRLSPATVSPASTAVGSLS
jgi:hypothetical protein